MLPKADSGSLVLFSLFVLTLTDPPRTGTFVLCCLFSHLLLASLLLLRVPVVFDGHCSSFSSGDTEAPAGSGKASFLSRGLRWVSKPLLGGRRGAWRTAVFPFF